MYVISSVSTRNKVNKETGMFTLGFRKGNAQFKVKFFPAQK